MTNLEFIEKGIKNYTELIEDIKKEIIDEDDPDMKTVCKSNLKYVEESLNHYQQIKDELEIMELIKNGWSSMETTLAGDQIMRFQNLKIDDWVKLWNRLEEILLKKTLEVSNEKENQS